MAIRPIVYYIFVVQACDMLGHAGHEPRQHKDLLSCHDNLSNMGAVNVLMIMVYTMIGS